MRNPFEALAIVALICITILGVAMIFAKYPPSIEYHVILELPKLNSALPAK